MKFSEIIQYAAKHPCSTLFVHMNINKYFDMVYEMEGERNYSKITIPIFGEFLVFDYAKVEYKLMFVRDDSIDGINFEEFNTITPQDYIKLSWDNK